MTKELCVALILLATALTFGSLVFLYRSAGSVAWETSRSIEPLAKTRWAWAFFKSLIVTFVANDCVAVASIPFRTLHPELEETIALISVSLIFCSMFFSNIFLDKRTPLRGILALAFCIITGVFLFSLLGVR